MIIDVTEENFQSVVVEGSMNHLVVVDCWASWCAPCRTLGPILEKLAMEFDGAFTLAKIDTETSPRLAQALQVQSIPDVKFVLRGQVVDQFTGVMGESEIREKLKPYVQSEADQLLDQIDSLIFARDFKKARKFMERYLSTEKDSEDFMFRYVKVLLAEGKVDEAQNAADATPGMREASDRIGHLCHLISLHKAISSFSKEGLDLHYHQALKAFTKGNLEEAMDALLEILYRDKEHRDQLARKVFLGLLHFVDDKAMQKRYQRRLSMAINI